MSDYPMDHIVIYARDLDESLAFYERVLGPLGFVRERGRLFARDGLFFDLRSAKDPSSDPRPRGAPGVDHIGFVARTREQVDALAAELADLGPERTRVIAFEDGDYALFLRDPDGLRIELTCYAAT